MRPCHFGHGALAGTGRAAAGQRVGAVPQPLPRPAHRACRGGGEITLDFPAAPAIEVPVPGGLAKALGLRPEATFRTGALGHLLTVLPDEAAVRGLRPDLGAIAALTRREELWGVIVTAAAAAPGSGYDFVSRFFVPANGIPEDPVTGSAHTALAPYWSARLGRSGVLTGFQASARTGLVSTELRADRVLLTGHAVTVLEATLRV